MLRVTQFNRRAETDGFIVAYPDGYKNGWADGRGTTKADREGVDDVAFVKALIDQLVKEFSIDESRIYATGISNGAIFSHRLGCELSGRLAAIAPVSGSLATPIAARCHPTRPMSVLGISGDRDPFIPWEGGEVRGGEGGPIVGVQATIDLWGRLNGCRGPGGREYLPVMVSDGTSVSKESYTECHGGVEVILYSVSGGGHAWPPVQPQLKMSGISSRNIDASEVIWRFFTRRTGAVK